mgnify:CR=1 FL=1|tara:strand:- start:330 stop:524 length:195 start_codon:yes stop_codon:yes gene_type:complete
MPEPELMHFPVSFMVRVTREEGEDDKELEGRIQSVVESSLEQFAVHHRVFIASNVVVNDQVKED